MSTLDSARFGCSSEVAPSKRGGLAWTMLDGRNKHLSRSFYTLCVYRDIQIGHQETKRESLYTQFTTKSSPTYCYLGKYSSPDHLVQFRCREVALIADLGRLIGSEVGTDHTLEGPILACTAARGSPGQTFWHISLRYKMGVA